MVECGASANDLVDSNVMPIKVEFDEPTTNSSLTEANDIESLSQMENPTLISDELSFEFECWMCHET